MNRHLLLTLLPIALAACAYTSPDKTGNDAPAPPAASTSVPPSPATDARLETPSLDAYHWRLSDARNPQGQRIDALFVREDRPVQLDFNAGRRVNVSNSCNNMMGGYSIERDRMTVTQLASTMRACPDQKLMALDREISERLSGVLAFAAPAGDPPTLVLTTASGDALTFTGEPTAETRYGSAGEIVFLEIAPETQPCPHPLIPEAQCLQVRQLHYDEQGLRRGEPGQWQHFYQQIEGYTHQPGIRNVLRVRRYPIANPPADAPDTAYVLDLVVESEIVTQ